MVQAQVSVQIVTPKQVYQLPDGQRQTVISMTADDGTFDTVLVLQPEDGGPQVVTMLSEFASLQPELVH